MPVREDAFNPAEFLLASLAGCIVKRAERMTEIVAFSLALYNHRRPHCALGGTSPAAFYRRAINAISPDQQVKVKAYLTPKIV